jgi:hypothetical protein
MAKDSVASLRMFSDEDQTPPLDDGTVKDPPYGLE